MNSFNSFQSQIMSKTTRVPSWSALSSGCNVSVLAIHAYDLNNVFVGGSFTTAGGATTYRIAKWNGTTNTWSALGSGCNVSVYAIYALSNVFVGGDFTTAGGVTMSRIAKYGS